MSVESAKYLEKMEKEVWKWLETSGIAERSRKNDEIAASQLTEILTKRRSEGNHPNLAEFLVY